MNRQPQDRNLNPTPEAVIAMHLWSENYARQEGGSMDFWDGISEAGKHRCRDMLTDIEQAQKRHAVVAANSNR